MSTKICHSHGVDEKIYLNTNCFTPNAQKLPAVIKLIFCCQEAIENGKTQTSSRYRKYIDHNLKKYGYVPFWILVRALSFGSISIFYDLMLTPEKEVVANEFGLTPQQLANILEVVVQFRNVVAHGERTFCAYLPKVLLTPNLAVIRNLNLPKNKKGGIKYGRKDILALLICCRYLLSELDFTSLVTEIDLALDKLKAKLSPMVMVQVRTLMGIRSIKLSTLIKVSK